MDLQKLRGEIDAIDTQMTDLFVKRMGLCAEVARYKKENRMSVVHQGREREILSRISALAGDELDSYALILFSTLFDLSRSYQSMLITEVSPVERKIDEALRSTPQMLPKKAVVACQGVEGAMPSRPVIKCSPSRTSCTSAPGRGCSPQCRRGCASTASCPSRTAPTAASTGFTT